jgi:hypothetical protein
MSPRPPPWWRLPLTQWRREAGAALGDCWGITPAVTALQLARCIVALDELGRLPAVERLMRQLLGRQGPRVLSVKARSSSAAPKCRQLLQPMLGPLVIGSDLRLHRRKELTSQQRELLRAVLQHEAQQRAIIDRLPAERRRRLCAAGYLQLIAVLALAGAEAIPADRERARAVAAELLHATFWLYGKPLFKASISLVTAVTGVRFTPSSLRWLARDLSPQ